MEKEIIKIKSQRLLRNINKMRMLTYILRNGEASRVELAREFSIDKKTVTNIVNELIRCNIITSAGFKESNVGRRQELLKINGSHSNYIGLDLGATHIIGLIVDLALSVKERIFFEIRPGLPVELILNQIKTIIKNLLASEKSTANIDSIGMCVPGFINPRSGISIIAENIPGWKDIKLKEEIEKEFKKNVFIEDSSRTLGLAEQWLGSGKHLKDFIIGDIGYGIGMAIFIDGKLYTGNTYKSGEIGHTIVKVNGPLCVCGNKGCLEAVASGKAIALRASEMIKQNKSKILFELTKGKSDFVTAQDVALAAEMGDDFSKGLLMDAGHYIGVALANAINIINPSTVILGGGLINAGEIFRSSIVESLKIHVMMGIIDDLEIVFSKFNIDGSALGCAILSILPLLSKTNTIIDS